MRPPRRYHAQGLAGCVQQHRCRQNGRVVGVYNAEQAMLDSDAGPWVTVCEDHGTVVNHHTLELALKHAPDPMGWCEDCNQGVAS